MLSRLKNILFRSRVRGVITVISACGLLIGGYFLLNKQNTTSSYQTAQAARNTLVTTVSASGTISSGSTMSITTTATGVVTHVYAANGDTVTQGQKIADIALDQNTMQKQASAWSTYLNAQATLNAAKAKMNSLQSALFTANQAFVNDKGVANPTDQQKADPKYIEEQANWLQAESDYNNQQSVIQAASAAVTSAWLSYQQVSSSIIAPANGIISGLSISEGFPITTSQSSSNSTTSSTSIGTIALPYGSLQATVNLSEIDVTHVQVGQKVTLTLDAFANKTFTGKVSSIDTSGTVSSGVTTYPTVITFDTPDSAIYSNMAANAKIITAVKDNALLVPSTAVQTSNGQATVRVIKNGQIQSVPVGTGDSNDTDTEITSGLSEGDTVVTSIITTAGSKATSSPFGGASFGGNRVFINGGGRRGG